MKYSNYILAFILFTLLSCKASKIDFVKCDSEFAFTSDYLIEPNDKFLSNIINDQLSGGKIGQNPMVVIDAIPYINCSKGKIRNLPITKSEIAEISVLDGENSVPLYGKQAIDGVILITTKSYEDTNSQ